MKSAIAWIALAVVLAGAAGLYYWRVVAGTEPPAPPPVAAAPPAPAAPEPPPVAHPVPAPPAGGPPLPALADSDPALAAAAGELVGRDAFARYFHPDGLVRRFVATVDNLPRPTTSLRLMPVKPVPGAFATRGGDGAVTIAETNTLRYRPYVAVVEAVDAKRLVAAYVRFYPLFQAAYEELGYPGRQFNDRLVQAIDDMLAAPDVAAPALAQPKVLYQYADADLEARSAGQKIVMRIGADNAARVKAKLRAVRRELTGAPPPA